MNTITLILVHQVLRKNTLHVCLFGLKTTLKMIILNIIVMAPSPAGTRAVQDSPTSILVSWSPSSDATGYMIHYDSSGGHSGSETVSGGSTDSYLLTGLHNGDTYNISIAALSTDLYT